ncbi:expressed unknown protein [Seminavis robusta]|uniref:Uncharacterized protein n=1 Tax=Seminavis robusta TaxID=568900 RepID=A0A9N8DEW3_9STRA|nr:expressed unknown protein [Seminavis robusta]|eukprot:Sro90_g047520.1 n/a (365) ;mRNA; r:123535-124629
MTNQLNMRYTWMLLLLAALSADGFLKPAHRHLQTSRSHVAPATSLTPSARNDPRRLYPYSLLLFKKSNGSLRCTQSRLITQWVLLPIVICLATANSALATYDFDLLNGNVQLEERTTLKLQSSSSSKEATVVVQLANPQLVGAGSGGAVFAFDDATVGVSKSQSSIVLPPPAKDLLVKISWETTTQAVQHECQILQLLEQERVSSTERCLGQFEYPRNHDRTMILVHPYMRNAVASIEELPTETARRVAVDQVARTLVQMLLANVITIDVQPLLSDTKVLFIDMTQAQVLSRHDTLKYTPVEQTLVSSFTKEMVALIPEPYWNIAQESVQDELQRQLQQRGTIPPKILAVLEDQTPFLDSSTEE